MIEVRIGSMGSTQGVKVSSRPQPKAIATTIQIGAMEMICPMRPCSESMGAGMSVAVEAPLAVARGKSTLRITVCGV